MPSLDIRPDHLHIVRDILQTHAPDREVWAFGSRAKWTARETSDLDLCVQGDEPLSFESMGLLRAAFEESDLPYKVDLVDWATTSDAFRKIIERDKVAVQTARRAARSTWRTMAIEDCMAAIIDYRGKTPTKTTSGIPLITAKIVKGGRFTEPDEFIAEDAYEQWMTRGIPMKGDIVLTTEAPLGEVAQLDGRKVALAQRIITLRGKPGLLDNTYLKFILQSHLVQARLSGRASGSTVSGIKQSELRKVELPIPSWNEQLGIAHILGSLDDKIELNRRINQTLETMAQAIFTSWFVGFDPVTAKIAAKAEGRDPLRAAIRAISGKTDAELDVLPREQFDQLAATAALFPDEMEESELGEVPKGWSTQALGEFLELSYGKSLPKEQRKEGSIPVYGSGGVGGFHESALVVAPGIVVGRKGTVGSLFWVEEDFYAIDTVFYVKPLSKIPLYWIYQLLKTVDIASLGADSAVPGVNRNTIYAQMAVVPGSSILEVFEKTLSPVVNEIKTLINQTSSLAALRDALLPRLLSGSLAVRYIESGAV